MGICLLNLDSVILGIIYICLKNVLAKHVCGLWTFILTLEKAIFFCFNYEPEYCFQLHLYLSFVWIHSVYKQQGNKIGILHIRKGNFEPLI